MCSQAWDSPYKRHTYTLHTHKMPQPDGYVVCLKYSCWCQKWGCKRDWSIFYNRMSDLSIKTQHFCYNSSSFQYCNSSHSQKSVLVDRSLYFNINQLYFYDSIYPRILSRNWWASVAWIAHCCWSQLISVRLCYATQSMVWNTLC